MCKYVSYMCVYTVGKVSFDSLEPKFLTDLESLREKISSKLLNKRLNDKVDIRNNILDMMYTSVYASLRCVCMYICIYVCNDKYVVEYKWGRLGVIVKIYCYSHQQR